MRVRIRSTKARSTALWTLLVVGLATIILGTNVFGISSFGTTNFNAAPLLPSTVHAQDKTLVWERFDVDIEVLANGTFVVSEHQTIRFTSGTFSNGYRDIPASRLDFIDQWEVIDDEGNVYRQSSIGDATPYTFSVENTGSRYVINWYFPPTSNASHTYTLRYRVHGGLRFYDGGDQVWWKAIYGNRSFPVLDARVRVVVPDSATIQEWAAYVNEVDARNMATADLLAGNQAVIFELQERLDAGEEFEVRVEFTPNVVDGVPAAWQAAADRAAAEREAELAFRERWGPLATLGFCAVGLLLTFGGPAAVYAFWYRRGRDKPVNQIAEYLPEPPTPLAPGLAGTLLDERVDMEDIIATLVDLARRKAISITEVKEEGLLRMGTDFIYRREREDVPLAAYERKLLEAIFGRNKQEVKLSELKNKFYTKIDGIKKAMYEEVVKQELFPANPDTVRGQFGCLGVGLLGLAALVGFVLANLAMSLTDFGFAPGVGLGITAIALIAVANFMPRKTDKGAEEAARWQAFRTYLRNIDKYSDIEAQKDIWDRYLPYAIAFGVDKQYMAKFAAVDAPIPGWYFPSPTLYGPYRGWYYGTPYGVPNPSGSSGRMGEGGSWGGGLGEASRGMGTSMAAMSAGLGTMLTSASSTFTSRPASSSSGGGWSGGGGFSGGGSFGGGGGGGGGGGFR